MKHVPLILAGTALVRMSFARPEPVKGLMDQAVAILRVR